MSEDKILFECEYCKHKGELGRSIARNESGKLACIETDDCDRRYWSQEACPSCAGLLIQGPEPWCRRKDLHGI